MIDPSILSKLFEVLATALLSGGVASLAVKVFLEHRLNTRLEVIRGELNRLNTEHSVAFRILHEKRAECIQEIYSLYMNSRARFKAFISPLQYGDELQNQHGDECLKLIDRMLFEAIVPNRLFFDKEVSDTLEKHAQEFRSLAIKAKCEYALAKEEGKTVWLNKSEDSVFGKTLEEIDTKLAPMFDYLETEFRSYLHPAKSSSSRD